MNQKSVTKQQLPYDKKIGERFAFFRKKYIADKQSQASIETGINQSYFSQIEGGLKPVGYKVIDILVTKYNLNTDWLLNGEGDPQIKRTEAETPMSKTVQQLQRSNRELEAKVMAMEKTILIMQKNQEFFLTRIEKFLKEQESKR